MPGPAPVAAPPPASDELARELGNLEAALGRGERCGAFDPTALEELRMVITAAREALDRGHIERFRDLRMLIAAYAPAVDQAIEGCP